MSAWRPWPYAASAIVQHEWDTDQLNVWVIFKYPMDQTVKPAHGLWLCEVDDVLKAITVSAWQDEWTILLTVPDVLALPGRVTLEYDGPSESLRTTWDKQWEPWGPILSRRIPYLWEDILVVDTVNKRVGIQPGVSATVLGYAFTIVSPDGNEQMGLYHDNDNAYFVTTTGTYRFLQASDSAGIRFYGFDDQSAKYVEMFISEVGTGTFQASSDFKLKSLTARISLEPALQIWLNRYATNDVQLFTESSEGETERFSVSGWKAGDGARRTVSLQISHFTNNTALWTGVLDYLWDGNIKAFGRLVSGTLTHSAVGPTDDLNVSGVNTVFIDCSGGDVTIGGFVGGVTGQILNIVRLCAAANDATLEHNEGHGNQNIFLHKGLDETLTGEYGGWTLVCKAGSWFDVSHAKHV